MDRQKGTKGQGDMGDERRRKTMLWKLRDHRGYHKVRVCVSMAVNGTRNCVQLRVLRTGKQSQKWGPPPPSHLPSPLLHLWAAEVMRLGPRLKAEWARSGRTLGPIRAEQARSGRTLGPAPCKVRMKRGKIPLQVAGKEDHGVVMVTKGLC